MILGWQSKVLSSAFGGLLILAAATLQAADIPVADLVKAARSGDEKARVAAIEAIGARGAKAGEAVEGLTALLADPSASIKTHAARSLSEIGAAAKPAASALASLLKDPDPTVRRQAIMALMAIKPGPNVMVPLIVGMLEDSDEGVRMRILQAVSQAGADAVPSLIQALDTEKGAYWACIVLRDIGPIGKDAIPAVAAKLKDKRPEIRREAVLTLGVMGEAAKSVLPQLAADLDDPTLATAVTFAIGQIGSLPPGAEAKIKANAKSSDKLLSTVSHWTLARVHPTDKELLRQAAVLLIDMLKDQDPFVRTAAARALVTLPPAPDVTIPLFDKALATADATTAHYALDALASMGAPAVPRLMEALKYPQLRPQIVYILGQIGAEAAPATEQLSKLLDDPDSRVATEAALALAKIGPGAGGAVPRLTAALAVTDRPNAHGIVFALGHIGQGAAASAPKLLELVNDKNDRPLAVASAWALIQVQPGSVENAGKVLPVLVTGLTDPQIETRLAAAEILGSLGPLAKPAVPALQAASKDEHEILRNAALTALKQIGG